MVSVRDLKKIVMLSYLTDDMLETLRTIIKERRFDTGENIFKEGDTADTLYMLKHGKVVLVQNISENITVSLGAIHAGFSFGWSAMLDENQYTSNAFCAEPCEVYAVDKNELMSMLEENHSMGYRLTQRLLRVIEKRYYRRTEQFVKVITSHPDLKALFDDVE